MVMGGIFLELGVIVIIATALGLLARLLKQPPLLAYLITGVLLGPSVLNLLASAELLRTLSSIGIAFLLFIVGLNLNARVLKEVGPIALVTGIGQVLFTAVIGYAITRWLGFAPLPALYISVALTFSSTIIIVKLLSDKNDLDTLYGKIALGFLIVQDFIAIAAIILISGMQQAAQPGAALLSTAGKGVLLLAGVYLLYKLLLPRLFSSLARSQELLFLGGISWCFGLALASSWLGFSIEIAAFLAGISLAALPYHYELASRVRPLRDFFLVVFFVVLGAQLLLSSGAPLLWPAVLLSLFVLIGNPLIVFILVALFGYTSRTSFLAGLTVAQISEFSLIVMALGLQAGHVDDAAVSLVGLVGVLTIGLSTYLIIYGDRLYRRFAPLLAPFERRRRRREQHETVRNAQHDVILIGSHRMGSSIYQSLRRQRFSTLVVDFNPVLIKALEHQQVPYFYGDASDSETLETLQQFRPKTIISTIPSFDDTVTLLHRFRRARPQPVIFVTASTIDDALALYKQGADYVVLPHFIGGEHLSLLIERFRNRKARLKRHRQRHIRELRRRVRDGAAPRAHNLYKSPPAPRSV